MLWLLVVHIVLQALAVNGVSTQECGHVCASKVYTCSCNGVMDYPELGLQVMAVGSWLMSMYAMSKLKA